MKKGAKIVLLTLSLVFAHVVLLSLLLDYCFFYLDAYVATEYYTCWPHTLACLLVAERHTAVF
jgi:hypothetical protein